MLSSSHFIRRGRSRSQSPARARSASQDCAVASVAQGNNIFSFLTTAARSRLNRFDDFEGDAEEDLLAVGDGVNDDAEDIDQADNDGEGDDNDGDEKEDSEAAGEPEAEDKGDRLDKLDQPETVQSSLLPVKAILSPIQSREETNEEQDSELQGDEEASDEVNEQPHGSEVPEVKLDSSECHGHSQLHSSVHTILKASNQKYKEPRVEALTEKLRHQLGLTEDSVLVAEHSCWLFKSILSSGHLYITQDNVCFLAYLPIRKHTAVIRSGSLSKRSRRTPKYSRHWFILRENSLAYYSDASDVYFPSGVIDLRYAVHAELTGHSKRSSSFSLITDDRKYHFKADSPSGATEWVRALQKEIFRSKNEGDSIKIIIPAQNIIDIEESALADVGSSVKLRVVDDHDSYAIDEYSFVFFKDGPLAKRQIEDLMVDHKQSDAAKPESAMGHVVDTTTAFAPQSPAGSSTPKPGMFRAMTLPTRDTYINTLKSLSNKVVKTGVKTIADFTPFLEPPSTVYSGSSGDEGADDEVEESEDELTRYDMLSKSDLKAQTQSSSSPSTGRRKLLAPPAVVTKFAEMWEAGVKHYQAYEDSDSPTIRSDRQLVPVKEQKHANRRFRLHFSLNESESLVATYYCHIQKSFPIYGKLYLSTNFLCFRSLLLGTRTKMILPIVDIENVTKEQGFRFGYSGLVVVIRGHEELFFEFGSASTRDDCEIMILRQLARKSDQLTRSLTGDSLAARNALAEARIMSYHDALKQRLPEDIVPDSIPLIVSESKDSAMLDAPILKPVDPCHFTCLTIGSRGDVQPYIALAKGLMAEGHFVRIATHAEFKDWVEGHGIEFREIAGDPGELMQIMVEHGSLSVTFLRDAAARFRSWIDDLLRTSWEACKGTDILIESPSAMAGIHIAEALEIPYFRAFTMPWTRTRAYPHAFIVPEQKMGGSYNYLTYVLFDNVFWKGISSQVNKWRKETLGLDRTNLDQMQQTKVPFLYNVSPKVLIPPVDYNDWIKVTGYWFLDEGGKDFTPPEDLAEFINKAKKDKAKLVYIGFGSIVVSDAKELTKAVIKSVQKAGVRCILSKGWSDRLDKKGASEVEVPLPKQVFQIKSAPHDWLFPLMDAAVHHGGSGTTGASLRAGLPTIVKPFFGDQFFYASRVEDLGVGINLKKLTVSSFSKALWEVTHNERIISKARAMGESIRAENGVAVAVETLYRQLNYARSLIKHRNGESKQSAADSEESWMLVDDAMASSKLDSEFSSPIQSPRSPTVQSERSSIQSPRSPTIQSERSSIQSPKSSSAV
uniref:Sterol 3-beta-glucosyltransferase n=1 Tax=Blastobotrys adeninivorans TaxID=409370 RepID=A0A060T134_BLAAD